MTSKNLLTNIEKPIRILHYRIAWRLPSVICILIFFICISLGLNKSFAQGLEFKVDSTIYDQSDLSKVIKPGQAFISFTTKPLGPVSDITIWTYTDIKSGRSSIDWSYYANKLAYGRYHNDSVADTRYVIGIIDSNYYYSAGNTIFRDYGLPSLNAQLAKLGLDTPARRFAYISSLDVNNSLISVSPFDFRSNLQPWIIVGIVIAIIIPAWYLMRRFLRG